MLYERPMRWRLFSFAVGLASCSTIALELLLTRIFSVTMYYHFAYMVISIAMLGLSVSGVMIYLFPNFFRVRRMPILASLFMLAFALLTLWTLKTTLANPISLVNWRANIGRLGVLYLSAGLTMLSSGLAISLAIAGAQERIGRIYAFDLVGAALGCILIIPAVSAFGGPGAVVACGAVASISACLFALSAGDTASRWMGQVLSPQPWRSSCWFLPFENPMQNNSAPPAIQRSFLVIARSCSRSGTHFRRSRWPRRGRPTICGSSLMPTPPRVCGQGR
jgi:hypothetical protein